MSRSLGSSTADNVDLCYKIYFDATSQIYFDTRPELLVNSFKNLPPRAYLCLLILSF